MCATEATSSGREWTLCRLLAVAGVGPSYAVRMDRRIISGVTDDSRAVRPGHCFAAIRGGSFDGHDYVGQAVKAGATALIVERAVDVPEEVACVEVADSRAAIARLAAAFHEMRRGQRFGNLGHIGVTGTNGKTTTCELLRSVLAAAGRRPAMLGTVRNDLLGRQQAASMTTPGPVDLARLLLQAAEAGADWAVMETSSHALDQRRCDGLTFAAGVFTNLSGDHLDYHGTCERYLAAKKRLFDLLPPDAVAVVNADDPASETLVRDCPARVLRYGRSGPEPVDVAVTIEAQTVRGSTFRFTGGAGVFIARSALLGEHNAMNAAAAVTTAWALGIGVEAIREGLAAVDGVRGRLQPVSVPGAKFAVLVDYAHTDDALRHALRAVRGVTPGRVICVFGCGGDKDRSKRPRMGAAVGELADLAVVTSDNPRTEDPHRIIEEVLSGFGPSDCLRIVDADRRSAIKIAISEAGEHDAVLIAGKGHEDYQIVGRQRRHFDDVEVAEACLAARFAECEVSA